MAKERAGFGYASGAKNRSFRLAESYAGANSEHRSAKTILNQFVTTERLTESQRDHWLEWHKLETVTRFLEQRELGQRNDEYSDQPGLSVLFRRSGLAQALYAGRDVQHPSFPGEKGLGPYLEETFSTEDGNMYWVRFPMAVYQTNRPRTDEEQYISLFLNTVPVEDEPAAVDWSSELKVPSSGIVRIEAEEGELWQNPLYTPSGLVRAPTLSFELPDAEMIAISSIMGIDLAA